MNGKDRSKAAKALTWLFDLSLGALLFVSAAHAETVHFNYIGGTTYTNPVYTFAGDTNYFSISSGIATQTGLVSGPSPITKIGAGTIMLGGVEDNVGLSAIVDGGTLALGKTSNSSVHAIGPSLTINNGGTAQLAGTGGDQIFNGASVVLNSGGTFDLNGRSETFDRLTGAGTVTNSSGSAGALTISSSNSFTFDGILQNGAGTTSLAKAGSGTLTLTGASTYSGATTVTAGTLTIAGANRLSGTTAVTVASGATFALNGFSNNGIGSLAGGGTTTLGTSTLTVGGDNTSSTFSGTASGGTLAKIGSGTLTLAGTQDNLALAVTVSGGVLALGKTSSNSVHAVGPSLLVDTGGTVQMAGTGGDQIYDGAPVTLNAFGNFDLNGRNEAIYTLTGSGTVLNNSATGVTGTLSVGAMNGSSIFAGKMEDGAAPLAVTKIGSGTLTLSGTSTYTGTTTISSGTLKLTNTGNLHDQNGVLVESGATFDLTQAGHEAIGLLTGTGSVNLGSSDLDLTATAPSTFAGTLTGNGVITYKGHVTLTGNSTFSGTVSGAAAPGSLLQIGDGGTTGWISGKLAGSVVFNRSDDVNYTGDLDYISLEKQGGGTLTLSGNVIDDATLRVSAGTLALAKPLTSSNNNGIFIRNNATLDLRGFTHQVGQLGGALPNNRIVGNVTAGTLHFHDAFAQIESGDFANNFTGTGQITIAGNRFGTVTFSGANDLTYSSGYSVLLTEGLLRIGAATSLASASSKVQVLEGTIDLNGVSGVRGTAIEFGPGAGGLFNLNTASPASFNGAIRLDGTTPMGGNGDLVLSGQIYGSGGISKVDAGKLTLSGPNLYAGETAITAGTLALSGAGQLSFSSAVTVNAGATLALAGISASVRSLRGGGTVTNSVPNTTSTLSIGENSNLTFSGLLQDGAGSLALEMNGSATLILSGSNTYTGGTTINGGTLRLGSAQAVGSSGTVTVNDGSFHIAGFTFDLARIAGSGHLNSLSGGVFSYMSSADFQMANVMRGPGSLVKSGSGKLTLTGINDQAGDTTISGGTVALSGSGRLAREISSLFITNNATLDLNGASQALRRIGTSTTPMVGNIIGGGTLQLANESYVRSGVIDTTLTTVSSTAPTRLWIGGDPNATVFLKGTNDLTYPDNNQLIIGFSATTGPAGIVKIGNANALSAATQNVFLYSGTLDLNGVSNVRANTIQLADGVNSVLVNSNTASEASYAGLVELYSSNRIGGAGNLTLSGQLAGGGFRKIGGGTLTLTGASTYTGATEIDDGTLIVNGSIANSSLVTVNAGSMLAGSGTVGDLRVTSGGTVSPGNSPGTLHVSDTVFESGGSYLWEINDANGDAGMNWDLLDITGSLTINSTSGNTFEITIVSLDGGYTPGEAGDFDPSQDYSWILAEVSGGITGFNADRFTLNTSAFSNPTESGQFSISSDGSSLLLNYTAAVPEPAVGSFLLLGIFVMAAWRPRRKGVGDR